MTPRLAAAVLLLAAGACGPERSDAPAEPAEAPAAAVTAPAAAPAAPPQAAPVVALDGEGLRLVAATGAARPLAFGAPRAETLAILQRIGRPAPELSTNEECGAGPLAFADWNDGLQLVFQDDRFVGWSVDGASKLTTMSGVGVGSPRRQLEAAYDATIGESTLGTEFQAGGLGGLLSNASADARVTNLWAGVTCAFR